MTFGNILYTIILYPLIQIIEIAFKVFLKLFDNPGISVIGVSVVVTILCLPLYIVAESWQQIERNTQSKLKPGIDRIKSTFSGDEQYMILSTFYKQNHYHPIMALRSSFGLLIQIPFFMAAYSCLSNMQGLQGQAFLFIKDMGQQDAIISIGNFPINILPIAMTLINIIAGAIYTKGFPVKEKIQIYGMALLFLIILYNSPSGLVLYWTMNNVLSLVKNIFYKMKHPVKVLYYIMTGCILLMDIYLLFIYSGAASFAKKGAVCFAITLLIGIPYYLKAIEWLLKNPLNSLMNDKKLRNSLFFVSAIGLAILCGALLPSTLISSSTTEFADIGDFTTPVSFVWISFFQSLGLFVFWPLCIYFLFKEKIQSLTSILFSIIFICGLFNSFLFKGNYSSMDVTLKFIDGFYNPSMIYMLLNILVVFIVIFVLNLFIKLNKTKIITSLSLVIIFSISVLTFINSSKIKKDYKHFAELKNQNSSNEQTFNPVFHLTKNKNNVIIIMLDRSESAYFEDIVSDFPELKTMFSGFTFYKNALSFNSHTLMASPALYGGYEYTPSMMNKRSDVPLKQKHNEALLLLPTILRDKENYDSYLADLAWANYDYYSDMSFLKNEPNIKGYNLRGRYTSDFKKEFEDSINVNSLSDGIKRNLLWVSFFKIVPSPLRAVVYYKGSWWANESTNDLDSFIDQYSVLHYLPKITKYDSVNNSYCVINNESTHTNESIKELNILDFNRLSFPETKAYAVNALSLLQLGTWFEELKKEGCYDNSKIIIIADHGIGTTDKANINYTTPYLTDKFEKDHLNPLMLVKDFNENGELKEDFTFMTNADVPSLVLNDIVESPVNPFTNNIISSKAKNNGVLVTIDDLFMPHHSKNENIFTVKNDMWYRVRNNIFEDSNWVKEN